MHLAWVLLRTLAGNNGSARKMRHLIISMATLVGVLLVAANAVHSF